MLGLGLGLGGWSVVSSVRTRDWTTTQPLFLGPSCGLCTVLPARRLRACDHTHTHTPDVRIKLFTLKKGACMVAVLLLPYVQRSTLSR